jgi:hypothetical protein
MSLSARGGRRRGAAGFKGEPPPSLEPHAAGRPFSQTESARGAGDATSGHNKSAEALREEVYVLISVLKAMTFSSLVGLEQRQQQLADMGRQGERWIQFGSLWHCIRWNINVFGYSH